MPESETIYAYRRRLGEQMLTVACNWTDREQPCGLFDPAEKENPPGGKAAPAREELISNYAEHKQGVLQPYEARVVLEPGR